MASSTRTTNSTTAALMLNEHVRRAMRELEGSVRSLEATHFIHRPWFNTDFYCDALIACVRRQQRSVDKVVGRPISTNEFLDALGPDLTREQAHAIIYDHLDAAEVQGLDTTRLAACVQNAEIKRADIINLNSIQITALLAYYAKGLRAKDFENESGFSTPLHLAALYTLTTLEPDVGVYRVINALEEATKAQLKGMAAGYYPHQVDRLDEVQIDLLIEFGQGGIADDESIPIGLRRRKNALPDELRANANSNNIVYANAYRACVYQQGEMPRWAALNALTPAQAQGVIDGLSVSEAAKLNEFHIQAWNVLRAYAALNGMNPALLASYPEFDSQVHVDFLLRLMATEYGEVTPALEKMRKLNSAQLLAVNELHDRGFTCDRMRQYPWVTHPGHIVAMKYHFFKLIPMKSDMIGAGLENILDNKDIPEEPDYSDLTEGQLVLLETYDKKASNLAEKLTLHFILQAQSWLKKEIDYTAFIVLMSSFNFTEYEAGRHISQWQRLSLSAEQIKGLLATSQEFVQEACERTTTAEIDILLRMWEFRYSIDDAKLVVANFVSTPSKEKPKYLRDLLDKENIDILRNHVAELRADNQRDLKNQKMARHKLYRNTAISAARNVIVPPPRPESR